MPDRYSTAALDVLAELNGVDRDTMARVWPVASNDYMHNWLEALGAAKAAGLPYRAADRLLTPAELTPSTQGE